MDKYFGQRGHSQNINRNSSYKKISWLNAAQQTGCDLFSQKYIDKILSDGGLSANQMERQSISPSRILKTLISDIAYKDQRIELDIRSNDEILVDAKHIKFALEKIVENAIAYNDGKKIASIVVENTDREIIVSVRDQGIGICKYEKGKIFNPFYRGLDSAKISKGIGLGLTLCRAVLTNHDAAIWVESPGRGMGTSVYVSFPFEVKKKMSLMTASRPSEAQVRLAY